MPFTYKEEKNKKASEKVDAMLLTLPPFCKTYVRGREGRIAPLTMLAYIQRIGKFFQYLQDNNRYFGSKEMKDITLDDLDLLETEDIEEFAHWIRTGESSDHGRNNKESSVNNYLSAVSSLYDHFCRKGKIHTNPVANVERGWKAPHEIIRLNEQEEQAFISSASFGTGLYGRQLQYHQKTDVRDTVICLLLSRTGIRVSELVGLNMEDVDLERHCIRVLRKRNKIDTVFFDDEVTEWLKDYLTVRAAQNPDPDEHALFLVSMKGRSYGKRLSVRSVQILVKKYAVAGSPLTGKQITPHKLRATYATNMLKESNGAVGLVQKALSHSSPSTTALYTDLDIMDLEAARNTLMDREERVAYDHNQK